MTFHSRTPRIDLCGWPARSNALGEFPGAPQPTQLVLGVFDDGAAVITQPRGSGNLIDEFELTRIRFTDGADAREGFGQRNLSQRTRRNCNP